MSEKELEECLDNRNYRMASIKIKCKKCIGTISYMIKQKEDLCISYNYGNIEDDDCIIIDFCCDIIN